MANSQRLLRFFNINCACTQETLTIGSISPVMLFCCIFYFYSFIYLVALYFKALHETTSSPNDQIFAILDHLLKGNATHPIAFLGRVALSDAHLLRTQRSHAQSTPAPSESKQKPQTPIERATSLAKEALGILIS
jgi:hypothetical protein